MNIQLILTKEDQSKPLTDNLKYINELRNRGIQFQNKRPRLTIIHASLLTNDILNSGIPLAILERIDASIVVKRNELKNPNVKMLIKNTKLTPIGLNNVPVFYGRYHTTKILELLKEKNYQDTVDVYSESTIVSPDQKDKNPYRIMNIDQKTELDNVSCSKIVCGYSFCHYDKMSGLENMCNEFKSIRKNDVHFIGTSEYGKNTLITLHRKLCIEKINSLTGCSVICNSGRTQSFKDYTKSLLNTKIVVSPWGHGEACYRDFEALFCGCVLIKPDTGFVDCWPNIYQNNITYIPCKVDFSDLQEKVDWVKQNWNKLLDQRIMNKELVVNARKPEVFAEHISKILSNCIKRNNL